MIDPITRNFLISVAKATFDTIDGDLAKIIAKFEAAGRFADATEDEIEAFDNAFEAAEAA